jgi:hypothetical protein
MKCKLIALLTTGMFVVSIPAFAADENNTENAPSPPSGQYAPGPGMMHPGYGHGPGMMQGNGYGPGYGMGPGMMHQPGYGHGPGMMYGPGYGQQTPTDQDNNTNRPAYRGPGMMYGPGYGYQR